MGRGRGASSASREMLPIGGGSTDGMHSAVSMPSIELGGVEAHRLGHDLTLPHCSHPGGERCS